MAELLEQSIRKYLSDTGNGLTTTARVAARRSLADQIGRRIFVGRVPQETEGNFALTIRRVGGIRYHDVPGEPDEAQAIVEFRVLGTQAPLLIQELCETHVRLALTNYSGAIGNDGYVYGSTVVRDSMEIPAPPLDASDRWRFGYSMDIKFTYKQTGI